MGFLAAGPAASLLICAFPIKATAQVDIGSASDFAILAGAGITNTGITTINGDVGSYSTPTITGWDSVVHFGINHGGDSVTQLAKDDLLTGYNQASALPFDTLYSTATVIGNGQTFSPGVYTSLDSFVVDGNLILDAGGDPFAMWVFKSTSTLGSSVGSSVTLTGGANADNVFWVVGSSATLDTGTDFAGSILANASISLNQGATIDGRALALNGAVTLIGNSIIVPIPEPSGTALIAASLVPLALRRKRLRA